jgi:hypothetical protein
MPDTLQPSDDAIATAFAIAAHMTGALPVNDEESMKKRAAVIGELAKMMLEAVKYQPHFSKRAS